MTNIERLMKAALIDHKAMEENWRLKITSVYAIGADGAMVNLEVYKPRRKTPSTSWAIPVDTTKNHVYICRGECTDYDYINGRC